MIGAGECCCPTPCSKRDHVCHFETTASARSFCGMVPPCSIPELTSLSYNSLVSETRSFDYLSVVLQDPPCHICTMSLLSSKLSLINIFNPARVARCVQYNDRYQNQMAIDCWTNSTTGCRFRCVPFTVSGWPAMYKGRLTCTK